MATFHKFDCFVGDVGLKLHQLNTDTLNVYLTNVQPVVGNTVFGTPAEITAVNNYPAGGSDVQNLYSQTSGTGTMTGTTIVFTASGGSFGPFQFAVLYNVTAAAKNLIGWWDYGSAVTVLTGETFTVTIGASILTIT